MDTSGVDGLVSSLKAITSDLVEALPFTGLRELPRVAAKPRLSWPPLRIGSLEVPVPIVQGGMGVGISLHRLASAVADAGAVGVVAANGIGLLEKDYYRDGRAANLRAFRREIRAARQRTRGVIGVNIMVAVSDFHQLLDVAIEEKVDLVFMGAGLPIKGLPLDRMRAASVRPVPIVSSVRAVEMIFRMWQKIYNDVPDAVVFEGPLAGGHIGFSAEQVDDPAYQLEAIVPGIVEALKPFESRFGRRIPVIAGGGIYTGEDIYAALELGAAAVQMGTRFVATDECDADAAFKQAYVDATEQEIGLIHSPVGMPGRAIRNDFIRASEQGQSPAFKCAWQCLAACKADDANYCISIALNNARKGNLRHGFVFAGANAFRVDKIVTADTLVSELAQAFARRAEERTVARLEGLVTLLKDLRGQYDAVGLRVRQLSSAYEAVLRTRIRDATDAGIAGAREQYDSALARVRQQYDSALGGFRALQFQIAENLADAWAVLNGPALQS
ncbi:MAG: nitronate monooxygenase [Spirochaetaceae bacterium]|nr:MAG: nitronate monooxygenase [Spirochaetaceae bacterium]